MGRALRLLQLGLTWTGLAVALVALAALVLVRSRLAPERRAHGRGATVTLALSPLAHFASDVARWLGARAAASLLDFVSVALLCVGVTGAVGVLTFDVALSRRRVPSILRDLVLAVAFALVTAAAAREAGVNPLSLVTTSAVLTAVLGLALQGIIANLFAGLALQLDGTFMLGDVIQVSGRAPGEIREIRWRSTILRTRDGDTLVVPNVQLVSNEVLNFSRPRRDHRSTVRVKLPATRAPGRVRAALEDAARGAPGVKPEPAPLCLPEDLGPDAITYSIAYWISDVAEEARVEGEVRTRVWYAAQREGLASADPSPATGRASALDRVSIFAPLASADREALAASMRAAMFTAGEVILREGARGDSLLVVLDGEVSVTLGAREVGRLGAGDVMGEMSLMTGAPRQATCTARTEVSCLALDHAALRPLLTAREGLAAAIAELLAARERALADERARAVGTPAHDADATAPDTLLGRIRRYFLL